MTWLMLQRNLLYTAVTQAKRIVVLAGSRRVLAQGSPPRRSVVTCENAGPHSAQPLIAEKDEAAGSSPARPTPWL